MSAVTAPKTLAEAILNVCKDAEDRGMPVGTVMVELARAIGAIGGTMIAAGIPRKDMHDLFESSLTIMSAQADFMVSIANPKAGRAK